MQITMTRSIAKENQIRRIDLAKNLIWFRLPFLKVIQPAKIVIRRLSVHKRRRSRLNLITGVKRRMGVVRRLVSR